MGHPDHSNESFLKKWQLQLAGRSADVHRVAADVLALYYLFTSRVKPETKAQKIKQVASWDLPGELPSLDLLHSTFMESIGGPGRHRSDLYQSVAFAAGFWRSHAVVVSFRDDDVGHLGTVQVGGIAVHHLQWCASAAVDPKLAEARIGLDARRLWAESLAG
jgi:hypothetical protein